MKRIIREGFVGPEEAKENEEIRNQISKEYEKTWEIYPEHDGGKDDPLYYVEFNNDTQTWRLFKRSFIWSQKEWDKMEEKPPFFSREGHPWQLYCGEINPNENAERLDTKKFLKFLVDALNRHAEITKIDA